MSQKKFSERMGISAAPEQMKLNEVSRGLRARIWALVYRYIERNVMDDIFEGGRILTGDVVRLMKDVHVYHLEAPLDEFLKHPSFISEELKAVVLKSSYIHVIELLEFILQHELCDEELCEQLAWEFEDARAAYRLNKEGKFFYPISSPEQGKSIAGSLEKIVEGGYVGAQAHLRNASIELSKGAYRDSIRESIHAVESVACLVTGQQKATLSDALKRLADAGIVIHAAFRTGLDKIYGYTSDERGVRHAALNDDVAVDEVDAIFMFGACASFCSYLIEKKNKALQ